MLKSENHHAEDSIGFIKYDGERVRSGAFDAKKSARALIGLDEAIRHILTSQDPDLKGIDFELPVYINKGSWEISIPGNIIDLIQVGTSIVLTTYLSTAAKKWPKRISII